MSKNDITLSQVELQKLSGLEARRGGLQQAAAQLDREFKDTLDLIQDRHGVDLTSGEYAIQQDGTVVKQEEAEGVSEEVTSEPQQLNG